MWRSTMILDRQFDSLSSNLTFPNLIRGVSRGKSRYSQGIHSGVGNEYSRRCVFEAVAITPGASMILIGRCSNDKHQTG